MAGRAGLEKISRILQVGVPMRNQGRTFLLVFFLFLAVPWHSNAIAKEPETITWLILDLPPLFITKGPDAGKGIADRVQKMIIAGLQGRRSKTRIANASRIALELDQDSNVCFVGEFFGNPAFLTSIPTMVLPHHNVIVLKENVHLFGNRKEISLRELLKNETLIFGTAQNRLYGPALDGVLKEYAGAKNIYARGGEDTLEGLLKMLDKRRVHYLIEYPVSIRYTAEKMGMWDNLAVIPMQENAEAPPIRGAVRCPDTPWGRRLVQEINAVLRKIRSTPEYRKIMEDWIITSENSEEYWKIHENKVLKVTE